MLNAADKASNGAVGRRIAELSKLRTTYSDIAEKVQAEFGVEVSRDTVRRWLIAEGLVAEAVQS